jgi:hypothetical protein
MDATQVLTIMVSLFGVLVVGVGIPLLLLSRTETHRREDLIEVARQHREDRDAEWRRQDEVALRAQKAAEDLAASQKRIADQAAEAATLLLANNERVAANQLETSGKLETIHELVNSTLTHAMQSEFEAVGRELSVMREILELRRSGGQEPTQAALAAIAATETKLAELDAALADRAAAQARVNKGAGGSA